MTKNILIADDSPSVRRVVSIALSSAGYQVYEAVDGQGALDILERKDVSLIISDDQMPDMDGIALLSEIQKKPDYKDTPIIMLLSEIEEGAEYTFIWSRYGNGANANNSTVHIINNSLLFITKNY